MSSSAQLSTSRRLQDLLLQLQSFEEGTYKAKDTQERTALYLANERQSPSALHAKVWKTVPTTFLQLVATADESYVMSLASVAALESIHQTNVEPKKIERRRRMLEIMLMCIIGSCDLSENRMKMIRLAKEDQTEYLENQEESRVGQSEKQRTASCRQKAHLRSKAMEAIRRRFKSLKRPPPMNGTTLEITKGLVVGSNRSTTIRILLMLGIAQQVLLTSFLGTAMWIPGD
ncbi:hypothetical protein DB88DRAFT_470044 [Papiliotrema laurentii]|uniref:Uncharacterized protein n=1 Tax=Papiliotrema laurentii TaxID=5418 RepID=A0AAD9FWM5_PAPLA|nr:hypothetical protein DB88DRAFT_470044 [Papiliotrema laurentii]